MPGFPGGANGKEPDCQCRRLERHGFNPWVGKIPWRRALQPTPRKSHGQKSLVGYGPWGFKESDTTEHTQHTHTHMHENANKIYISSLNYFLELRIHLMWCCNYSIIAKIPNPWDKLFICARGKKYCHRYVCFSHICGCLIPTNHIWNIRIKLSTHKSLGCFRKSILVGDKKRT